jgi:hypothetical protein
MGCINLELKKYPNKIQLKIPISHMKTKLYRHVDEREDTSLRHAAPLSAVGTGHGYFRSYRLEFVLVEEEEENPV